MANDFAGIIRTLYGCCTYNSEEAECREVMAEILRDKGWHVAENDRDLRDLALQETDLVEPE